MYHLQLFETKYYVIQINIIFVDEPHGIQELQR